MEKIASILILAFIPFVLNSCTKSGSLTGGGSSSSGSSFGNSINGSVNGGLSNVAGATVGLYLAGNATPIGSATTASNGAFSLAFTNPGGASLLYLKVTGGNAGSGTNSNSQFLSIAGTTASLLSTLSINEMTTAATEQVAMDFGILQDTAGTITLAAPASATGVTNVVSQFNNMISSGTLNTVNTNLSSSIQTGLKSLANAFASCIENSSKCSTLFTTATSSTNTAALSLLESGVNAITNSSSVGSPLYTLAYPLSSSTGYTLTSSSAPGGFTFANPLPVSISGFSANVQPLAIAVDSSGNVYVGSSTSLNIMKFSPQGVLLQTITTGVGFAQGIAIDAAGNLWNNSTDGFLHEHYPDGTAGPGISTGGSPKDIIIDAAGNLWADDSGNHWVKEYNSSGTLLQTYTASFSNLQQNMAMDGLGNIWLLNGAAVTKLNIPSGITSNFPSGSGSGTSAGVAVDSGGNVWFNNSSTTVCKMTTAGSVIGNFSAGSSPAGIAIDSSQNIWVANGGSGVTELNSAGATVATYSFSGTGTNYNATAVDQSGNLWVTAGYTNASKVFMLPNVAVGPNFFPYSGPIWP